MRENELRDLEKSLNLEISKLIDSIKESHKIEPETRKEVTEKLSEMRRDYEKSKNIFLYAEIQLGLARFLDFNLDVSEFINFIHKISIYACQILHIHHKICGRHEDGACVIARLMLSHRPFSNLQSPSWPSLPFAHALSFLPPVKPIILPINTILYRKIKKNGNEKGHWWMESKPASQRQWRSDYAVLTTWNEGTECLTGRAKQEIKAWSGKTAPQPVYYSSTYCHLEGGGLQIWLSADGSSFPLDIFDRQ